MQMTEKGGNKLNGNYDIGIKWQKAEVFWVFMGLAGRIYHNYILFLSVCMRRYYPDNLL